MYLRRRLRFAGNDNKRRQRPEQRAAARNRLRGNPRERTATLAGSRLNVLLFLPSEVNPFSQSFERR